MPTLSPITVLKFGSSVLPTEAHLPRAVEEIARHIAAGQRVVAVVSAFGSTTDDLIALARHISPTPPDDALATLLATGESRSVALLTLALHRAGINARALDSAAINLRTRGTTLDAQPISLDARAVIQSLDEAPVLVVPGFIGRDAARNHTTLLGRGGSDLSALFIAAEIGASCTLLKDVDGLYDRDPAASDELDEHAARRFNTVTYHDVLGLDEGIVQHKAVRYARSRALEFTVSRLGAAETAGTLVGHGPSLFADGTPFEADGFAAAERSAA